MLPPNTLIASLPQTKPVRVISLTKSDVFADPCLIVTVVDSGDGDLRRALTCLVPDVFSTFDLLVSDGRKGLKLTDATVLAIAEPNAKGWLSMTVSAAKENTTPIPVSAQ